MGWRHQSCPWMYSNNQRQQPAFVQPWEMASMDPVDPLEAYREEQRRRELQKWTGTAVGIAATAVMAVLVIKAFR